MNKKAQQLAEKLKALAVRGIGGEKENAQRMLEKHLEKHGMTIKDVESDVKEKRIVNYKGTEQLQFYSQVVSSVLGKGAVSLYENGIAFTVTNSEFIEIEAKVSFFWETYLDEKDVFYKAFIQTNELYVKDSHLNYDEDKEETEEEYNERLKVLKMQKGIDQHQFNYKDKDSDTPNYLQIDLD